MVFGVFTHLIKTITYCNIDKIAIDEIKCAIISFCECQNNYIILNSDTFEKFNLFINSKKHRLSDNYISSILSYIEENKCNDAEDSEYDEDSEYEYNDY